jgi:FkbM family methyltransferase
MTGQYYHAVAFIPDMPDEIPAHGYCDESSKLIRPDKHFHFSDGPTGVARRTWDEVALYNEYKLPNKFSSKDVIIDCGAHMGAFSWSCLRRGAGLVIAVEPMAENVERLVANLERERNRIEIIPKGVWRENGSITLEDEPLHEPGVTTTFNLLQTSDSGRIVQTITMDSVIDRAVSLSPSGRVRLLKVDCEGGEYPGLLWCSRLGLVDEICGEVHRNTTIDGTVYSTEDIERRLTDEKFSVEVKQNGPNTDLLWAVRK